MNKGRLIVFSAPSGCGKGTILAEILKDDKIYCSISTTTRAPREGEVDGVNYYFVTKEQFEANITSGKMLEHAEYCENYYGTLLEEVDSRLGRGIDVILEIEVQGALNVKAARPEAIMVFVIPPSISELRRRLLKRGTEPEEVINKRVSKAIEEIPYAAKYDYVIVNDALEEAIDDFRAVIKAERLKSEYAAELLDEVMKNA